MKIKLKNESETIKFARNLARCVQTLQSPIVIYLEGELGSGKTTLARGFIQYLGFDKVKSPTFSLVESYQNNNINIHHFDLYRVSDPEELDYIGIREYSGVLLIEWAKLGRSIIAKADMMIKISGENSIREIEVIIYSKTGRQIEKCINL